MGETCKATTDPNTLWTFCPSIGAAYTFTVLFGLLFAAHVAQGIYYRKWYTWVISMGALWQTIAYIFRVISIADPASLGDYGAWFVLILVAPLWTNAFVYMIVGRMVWNFVPTAKILGITAWRFGLYFVMLDVVAFIIQVYGAASAEQESTSVSQTLQGLHIYMAGVGIQQLFILIFVFFATQLHRALLRGEGLDRHSQKQALRLLYTVYAVLALITLRIVFRLCEYSNGLDSTIPNHEAYQYCLDSLPMLLAFILLSIVHPCRIMPGKECEIPSRRERKKTGARCKHIFTSPSLESHGQMRRSWPSEV
ncbi:hypothetical protein PV05_09534 [Exophiala xenobiotica]|uniref:RTA1 domain protein n=1 Tax=Exophiala xenobiotica TaxID=348802 RepID=A0A0D2BEU7_9EURO|nr:uncharacterized protein PV05_09534 [Exophiala xenobiotica]KIW50746.1 hypothetical protein PV05_09534 [Exophiala xenobiotica]